MEHTPGPWRYDGRDIVSIDDAIVARIGAAELNTLFNCGPNARLIAAAPEMLEALKLIVDSTAVLNHLPIESQQFICAVIAKVEGRK